MSAKKPVKTALPMQDRNIIQQALEERIKELKCLHSITNLSIDHELSLGDFLKRAVEFIPSGFQYPDIICAKISYLNRSYKTDNFRKSKWKLASSIKVTGNDVGSVEVFYSKKTSPSTEDPFLKEERELILSICSQLGVVIEKKRAEAELKKSQEELRSLAGHLQNLREQERKLMAQKIHDELGQELTVLKMDLSFLKEKLPTDQKNLLDLTRSIMKTINKTALTVQRISTELRPRLLDDVGLIPAVEWYVKEFQKRTRIKCEFIPDNGDIDPDIKKSTVLFRVLQEALTNVARHAAATRITISLSTKPDKLILEIRDNGKGITQNQISSSKSFGILGIRESVFSLRGKMEIKGIPFKSTTIKVSLPLNKD